MTKEADRLREGISAWVDKYEWTLDSHGIGPRIANDLLKLVKGCQEDPSECECCPYQKKGCPKR
jgi:hypothetical protein